MGYGIVYIKKCGVTLEIPLSLLDYLHDSSDYIVIVKIPRITLEILVTTYLQMIIQFPHIAMWEKIGLGQSNKTNKITWRLWERPTRKHLLEGLQ